MKICTWNLLADCFAKREEWGFPHVDESVLTWEHRFPLIIKMIRNIDADIFCFQEVDKFQDLSTALPEYSGYYHKSEKSEHGIAVFVRRSSASDSNRRIEVHKCTYLKYSELCSNSEMSQVALQLDLHIDEVSYTIINTHLKAKAAFELVRLEQVTGLLKWTNQLDHTNIIICGDFNETYDNSPCQLMSQDFTSACSRPDEGPSSPFTTVKLRDKLYQREIDYIWIHKENNISIRGSKVLIPEVPEVGLPSKDHPSDHLPVIVTLGS